MVAYQLVSWGANSHGQLGQGDSGEEDSLCPQTVELDSVPEDVVKVAGGAGHTLLLDASGRLHGCGRTTRRFHLLEALATERIIDVVCGWDSSLALTASGRLFAWGSNSHGQLGLDEITGFLDKPVEVNPGVAVSRVAVGLRHTAIITRDGRVMVAGAGNKGQLGVDLSGKRYVNKFQEVPELKNVKEVSCGQHHTVTVTIDNQIFAWGDNKHGQLGLDPSLYKHALIPTRVENYKRISTIESILCGWTHSAVLTSDKSILLWGRNSYGQLGRGKSPVSTSWEAAAPLTSKRIQQLSIGSEHNIALTEDGAILSWGWNEHGNCGNGSRDDVLEPVQIMPEKTGVLVGTGAGHSFAVVKTDS